MVLKSAAGWTSPIHRQGQTVEHFFDLHSLHDNRISAN